MPIKGRRYLDLKISEHSAGGKQIPNLVPLDKIAKQRGITYWKHPDVEVPFYSETFLALQRLNLYLGDELSHQVIPQFRFADFGGAIQLDSLKIKPREHSTEATQKLNELLRGSRYEMLGEFKDEFDAEQTARITKKVPEMGVTLENSGYFESKGSPRIQR